MGNDDDDVEQGTSQIVNNQNSPDFEGLGLQLNGEAENGDDRYNHFMPSNLLTTDLERFRSAASYSKRDSAYFRETERRHIIVLVRKVDYLVACS